MLGGVLPQAPFDCAGSRRVYRVLFAMTVPLYRVSVHVLKQNVVLRDKRRRSDEYFVDVAKTFEGLRFT